MGHVGNVLYLHLGSHFTGMFSLWKFYFWMFLMRGQDLEDQEGPGLGNRDGEDIEWMSI